MDNFLHYNEIARAIRLLCQSTVLLSKDTDGTDQISVGSNRLFSIGDEVELIDDDTPAEAYEVSGLVGLTIIQLTTTVSGQFTVANNAMVRLAEPVLDDLRWVGQGRPLVMPQPAALEVPAIVVEPAILDQPMGEGTNRSARQDYHFRIYYLERPAAGSRRNEAFLDRVSELFSLLTRDIYLGGTCWYAQIIRLDPDPPVQQHLAEQGLSVDVAEIELLARCLQIIPN